MEQTKKKNNYFRKRLSLGDITSNKKPTYTHFVLIGQLNSYI